MKAHTELNKNKVNGVPVDVWKILELYPQMEHQPISDSRDVPNNWLRMHGYAMHKKYKRAY